MKLKLSALDHKIANWMYKHGTLYLRVSLAIVFIWFGALKPLGLSPAEDLVRKTVYWLPPEFFLPLLGWWEVFIGLFLLYRPLVKWAIILLFLQMPGTIIPLFLLPDICFHKVPFALTLEGQYIIKNLVLISAGLVIGGTANWEPTDKRKV